MGEEWYFCVRHRRVEPADGCPAKDRLGPYPSPEEAGRALEIAGLRNERWENDPRWREDD